MAETLGSLIDKLSIVNLKLWHCQEALFNSKDDHAVEEMQQLKSKNISLLEQRQRLIKEIDEWFAKAFKNPKKMVLSNPANKLYGRFRKE